jgi:hypothetical protein
MGVGSLVACEAYDATTSTKPASGASHSAYSTPTTTVDPGVLPSPNDIKIHVTIISKNCFGSAGCNVSYEIDPQYVGTAPLPKSEFRVIYQITGGDSPQTDSLTVTGGTLHYTKEGHISTHTEDVNITAVTGRRPTTPHAGPSTGGAGRSDCKRLVNARKCLVNGPKYAKAYGSRRATVDESFK